MSGWNKISLTANAGMVLPMRAVLVFPIIPERSHYTQGAHLLLQVRTKTLNNELKKKFKQWYPGFQEEEEREYKKAA